MRSLSSKQTFYAFRMSWLILDRVSNIVYGDPNEQVSWVAARLCKALNLIKSNLMFLCSQQLDLLIAYEVLLELELL